jgi:hypothetical protein
MRLVISTAEAVVAVPRVLFEFVSGAMLQSVSGKKTAQLCRLSGESVIAVGYSAGCSGTERLSLTTGNSKRSKMSDPR